MLLLGGTMGSYEDMYGTGRADDEIWLTEQTTTTR